MTAEYAQNILEGACEIEWLSIGNFRGDVPDDVRNTIALNGGSQVGQTARLYLVVSRCSIYQESIQNFETSCAWGMIPI